jgi:hypothetical protein
MGTATPVAQMKRAGAPAVLNPLPATTTKSCAPFCAATPCVRAVIAHAQRHPNAVAAHLPKVVSPSHQRNLP